MATQSKVVTSRLGTQFRGKLTSAFGQRNHNHSSLWYVYSPRDDKDWVLKSDLEWDHFVLAEADCSIRSVDYSPSAVHVRLDDGTHYSTILDAIVTYHDGSVEWREVKPAEETRPEHLARNMRQQEAQIIAAKRANVGYTRWTEREIRQNTQLLSNWRRVIAWLSAAREYPLGAYQAEVLDLLQDRGPLTLSEVEDHWGEPRFPLAAAAIFTLLQRGLCTSDLDVTPLSRLTSVYLSEGART